jgi:RimJ/RimL family protein N-acetyltransferase
MNLNSNTIFLRLAEIGDANFILSLRRDERYNKHLSITDDNIENQKKWLKLYKEREINKEEYYFIIHRNSDSSPIGTVRVYDFKKDENSFCWGSWILNENKTRYAALECAILIYDFAFLELGYKRCHMDIRKENLKVIEFHKKFGVKIIGENENDLFGYFFIDDFLKIRKSIIDVINNYKLDLLK